MFDPSSTELQDNSTGLTKLAQSLSSWVLDKTNPSSTYSMQIFDDIRQRAESLMDLKDKSSLSLSLEIIALQDLELAFRLISGAGNNSRTTAANKHLINLLWDPSCSSDDFEWDDIMSASKFTASNEIVNSCTIRLKLWTSEFRPHTCLLTLQRLKVN